MRIDQLRDELGSHPADPRRVQLRLRSLRARRLRYRAVISVIALVVVLVAVAALGGLRRSAGSSSEGGSGAPNFTYACGTISLSEALAADDLSNGASIIVGRGHLTGVVRNAPIDGGGYRQFVVDEVRVLAGPALTTRTAWIAETWEATPLPATVNGGTRAPGATWSVDGSFFGEWWPKNAADKSVLPMLNIQPYQDGLVIFTRRACVDVSGVPNIPYSGTFSELPGEDSNRYARDYPVRAVKLADIVALLHTIQQTSSAGAGCPENRASPPVPTSRAAPRHS